MAKTYPWGGFGNGLIPDVFLTTVRGELFEKEAAGWLVQLEQAFQRKFGYQAVILQGYRALGKPSDKAGTPTQWGLYNLYKSTDPTRAAYPGTSNHGFARAADFGSGVDQMGSQQKDWMNANAPVFGWHPTGDSFPKYGWRAEPWHFDYIPGTADPAAAAALLEDDLMATPEERQALINDLLNYPAFDGGVTISQFFKDITERVSQIGDVVQQPVLRDGKQVKQIQDNADTNTMVRELLARTGTAVPSGVTLTQEQITQAVKQAVADLISKATS